MPYKKWVILLITTSIFVYGLLFLFYIIIDPDQIFNTHITKYKFGYTKYYSKHQYQKLKEKKYTLVFGTSRSQCLSSRALDINILNFHNIYGEPGDILNFLEQLDNQQIRHINHIYYLVSLTTMRDETSTLDYRKYDIWDKLNEAFPLSNLSFKYLLRDIVNNIRKNTIYYYVDDDGSQFLYNKNKHTVLNERIMQEKNWHLKDTNSIDTLLKLDHFCKENNIKITYYTPTYSDKYIIRLDQIEYLWKRLLDGGIEGFYGLYYIDKVSNNIQKNHYVYFSDSSHLNYTMMNNIFEKIVMDKNTTYFIKNKEELKEYLNKIKKYL